MVIEGLKLMVLGMGVVFIFLALLVVIMQINARLLRGVTEREMQPPVDIRAERRKREMSQKAKSKVESDEKQRLVAVIAAALAAHRAKQQGQ